MDQLLGASQVAGLLGLSRRALFDRRQLPDFPGPDLVLGHRSYWRHSTVIAYAQERCQRFEERPAIVALAETR